MLKRNMYFSNSRDIYRAGSCPSPEHRLKSVTLRCADVHMLAMGGFSGMTSSITLFYRKVTIMW